MQYNWAIVLMDNAFGVGSKNIFYYNKVIFSPMFFFFLDVSEFKIFLYV